MLKALIKKQFMSLLSSIAGGSRNKKKINVALYVGILAFVTLMFGLMFGFVMYLFAEPLISAGYDWLLFTYAGIIATAIPAIFSMFMAQSQLYEAKDNELLLAMPIPPSYILLVRVLGLYAVNFLFSATVLVPTCIVYSLLAPVAAAQVVNWILMIIIHPLLSLIISCLLGFLCALITSRMRDKTLFTVLVSMVFLIAYFVVYTQLMNYVSAILAQSEQIAHDVMTYLYPLYKFGNAFMGDFVGVAVWLVIDGALFGALYAVLSKTYIKLVTGKRAASKAKYKGLPEKPRSPFGALLKKEAKHFFGSGIYMLNCGLGVILLAIATVFLMVKGQEYLDAFLLAGIPQSFICLAVCLAFAFICGMDCVSAPSISLEGKTLWILQASPVNMWQLLKVKLTMHYLVTAPAATLCMIPMLIMLQPSWGMIILMLLSPSVVVTVFGELGLVFNLKKPNMEWINETFVIKQSMSVLFTMLSSWGVFLVFGILFALVGALIPAEVFLLVCLALLTGGGVGLWFWLKRRGSRILANL